MFKVALIHVDEMEPTPPDWVREQLKSRQIEFVFRQCDHSALAVELGRDADVGMILVWSKPPDRAIITGGRNGLNSGALLLFPTVFGQL